MSKITRYLLVALAAGFMVSSAQAAMLSLVGVGNWSNQSLGNLPSGTSYSTTGDFGPGGGALLDFHLFPGTMFEVGALYVTQKFDYTGTSSGQSASGTFSGNYIQVPVMLRFRLLPMITIGVGGFGERGVGTPTQSSGGVTSNVGFPSVSDFGLEGSAGLRLPLTMSTRLILEGRYLYGLTNLGSGGTTDEWRNVQAIVGLSFPFGYSRY